MRPLQGCSRAARCYDAKRPPKRAFLGAYEVFGRDRYILDPVGARGVTVGLTNGLEMIIH